MSFSVPFHRLALLCAVAGSVARPVAAQPVSSRGLSPAEQAAHVLSRLTFGARPGDLERLTAMGVDRWIDLQLRPAEVTDSLVRVALAPFDSWTRPTSDLGTMSNTSRLVTGTMTVRMDSAGRRIAVLDSTAARIRLLVRSIGQGPNDQFAAGKIAMAQLGERQLLEVITDFWENHFSVYGVKMPGRDALIRYNRDAIRPNALGKFRVLLGAVATSPAMLFYLDNQLSAKDGINENYARELLELHTLGVDGGYTQDDVINVARALTGWMVHSERLQPQNALSQTSSFRFIDLYHDKDAKAVLGVSLAANRGIEDGEQVLDILARHPSTARYISWKLARRLVSDTPPEALVQRAAATFTRTDGDIAEVVRTIVTSDEFFSRAAFRAKVKTPFEFVVSARRALNASSDSTIATVRLVSQLGLPMFGRLSPDGWPDDGASWINSGSVLSRVMLTADVAEGKSTFGAVDGWAGFSQLAGSTAEEQVDGVVRLVLNGIAEPSTRDALRAVTKDVDASGADGARRRLREMLAIALASPEFQRR